MPSARIEYRTPYDWQGLNAWLGARAIAGIESVESDAYVRGSVRVSHDGNALIVRAPRSLRDATARARRVFDADADPTPIAETLRRDPLLRPLLEKRPGIRVPGAWDPFELAVRAIVGQQVSVAGARTILGRIAAAHGFAPERLASVTLEGMPRQRAEAIRTIARSVADGEITFERGNSLDDSIARLCALPGIGPWTAHYIAMRALGERDAFPAGDLILRRKAGDLTARELERRAERWRPYRAYAAMLLWMS